MPSREFDNAAKRYDAKRYMAIWPTPYSPSWESMPSPRYGTTMYGRTTFSDACGQRTLSSIATHQAFFAPHAAKRAQGVSVKSVRCRSDD